MVILGRNQQNSHCSEKKKIVALPSLLAKVCNATDFHASYNENSGACYPILPTTNFNNSMLKVSWLMGEKYRGNSRCKEL